MNAHGQLATWSQLTSCPGPARIWTAATATSGTIYVGTGRTGFSGDPIADFWEYEVATDMWTQLPDYPGGVREGATAFTIGDRVFLGFGTSFIQFTNTLHEYLPATGTWQEKPSVPGIGFAYSHGFVIGETYYIGPENGTNNVYAFNATTETWSQVASFPGQDRRAQVTFSVGGKGYLGSGLFVLGGTIGDWWEYDPVADSWSQIASLAPVSDQSCGTAVNDVGYVFNVGGNQQQLFRYDAASDQWVSAGSKPGDRVANARLVSVGDKGYLVFGERTISGGNITSNELWEFEPGSGTFVAESDGLGPFLLIPMGNGSFMFTLPGDVQGPCEMQVHDVSGRLLHEERFIDIGGPQEVRLVAKGMVVVTIREGDKRYVQRCVLE